MSRMTPMGTKRCDGNPSCVIALVTGSGWKSFITPSKSRKRVASMVRMRPVNSRDLDGAVVSMDSDIVLPRNMCSWFRWRRPRSSRKRSAAVVSGRACLHLGEAFAHLLDVGGEGAHLHDLPDLDCFVG